MPYINVTVRNKIAVNPAQDRYVCGNSDYIVRFDFDSEWDEFETKTARFIKEDGTYNDQVFMGNECPVPVIENTYKIMVGVYAGNLSTTTAAYVPAKKSILCGGGSPAAPEDDVYHQIMEMLNHASGLPEGAEANMQLVTDGEGNPAWEEKPFYEGVGFDVLLPESTPDTEDNGTYGWMHPVNLIVGNTYTVAWNGDPYTCTASTFNADGITVVVLGNTAYIGGKDTSEPFLLVVFPDETAQQFGGIHLMAHGETNGAPTLKIEGEGHVLRKIDGKFLPAFNWNAEKGEDGHIENRTHFAANVGKIVYDAAKLDGKAWFIWSSNIWVYKISPYALNEEILRTMTVSKADSEDGEKTTDNNGIFSKGVGFNTMNYSFGQSDIMIFIFSVYDVEAANADGLNAPTEGLYIVSLPPYVEIEVNREHVRKLDAKYLDIPVVRSLAHPAYEHVGTYTDAEASTGHFIDLDDLGKKYKAIRVMGKLSAANVQINVATYQHDVNKSYFNYVTMQDASEFSFWFEEKHGHWDCSYAYADGTYKKAYLKVNNLTTTDGNHIREVQIRPTTADGLPAGAVFDLYGVEY